MIENAGAGVSFEQLKALFPNRWRVRSIREGDPRAYWIVANPKTSEGRVFPKDQQQQANDWCALKNAELAEAGTLDGPTKGTTE